VIKRIIGVSVAILFVWVVAGRLAPHSDAREKALRIVAAPVPPVAGRDGSAALWLLDHDVPVADQARVASDLYEYLDQVDVLRAAKREQEADALVDPRDAYPRFPVAADAPWLCTTDEAACLERVRQDPEAAAAAMVEHAGGLAAVDRLLAFDGVRFSVAPSMSQPLPQHGRQRRLMRTRQALRFVQGDAQGGMADTCRGIAGWRRIGAGTDTILTSMIGAAYVRQDLQMLAEMLAELPPGTGLPEECAAALSETRDAELELCLPMSVEFRAVRRTIGELQALDMKPLARTLYTTAMDLDHANGIVAGQYAQYCSPAVLAAARADRSFATLPREKAHCLIWERVPDPIGCWLAEQSDLDATRYVDRRTDLAAQLALMRTVVWLRSQPAGTVADVLVARPASLGLRRSPELSSDGKWLSMPLLDVSRQPRFALRVGTQGPSQASQLAPRM
jgi:hypothetical protein